MIPLAPVEQEYSSGGGWRMERAVPDPALAGLVLRYGGYDERGGEEVVRREVATPTIPVIFNFGSGFEVSDGRTARYDSFAAGLYDRHVTVASSGRASCLQVDFTPLGAGMFLGLPPGHLANRIWTLDDLLGNRAGDLLVRLYDAGSWARCFALIEAEIIQRLGRTRAPPRLVQEAWRMLDQSRGRRSVSGVAAELECSRKHLAALFREHIGLSPKTAARVIRFDHAIGRLREGKSHAGTAIDCGYADQAHMIRDCQAFSGCSPRELARRYADDHGLIEH
jgi:AraC-like DNA-binding protein